MSSIKYHRVDRSYFVLINLFYICRRLSILPLKKRGLKTRRRSWLVLAVMGPLLTSIKNQALPHCSKKTFLSFHRLPQRLELQGSCKSVENVYNILHLIWKMYHDSPKSVRAWKSIADELEINVLKPKQVKGTRWLPHISRALKVFVSHKSARVRVWSVC